MKGKAHVYAREHINTDEIIPARYLTMDREEELAKHAMEGIDESFVRKVRRGDFIVASSDFGCGSSREHAVMALRGAGIRVILAETFARIFFRNCINNGIPAIECPGISGKVFCGDELQVEISWGKIKNLTRKEEYDFVPMPDFALEMIEAGGLLEYIKKRKFKGGNAR